MEQHFRDKVVIITGASSGIGLASAYQFAAEGAKVVLAARSADKLKQTFCVLSNKGEREEDFLAVPTDVSKEEDCKRLIESTIQKFGRIDVLVNNAGISMRAMFKELDLSVLHKLMDVNFWGTVYCTKYALPYLLESKGTVVGVTSIAGFKGLPARTGYSSSKFAIIGFLDTLRVEHLKDNLNVLIFAPGFTASNVRYSALTADGTPQGETPREEEKMMSAQECARRLTKAVYKRKKKVILTTVGHITVWLNKFFPSLLDRLEYNYMKKEPDSPLK